MVTIDGRFIKSTLEDQFKVRSYSGRYMYGEHCIAVQIDADSGPESDMVLMLVEAVIDKVQDFGSLTTGDVEAAIDKVRQAMRKAHTDSLGLGTVVYWPGIEFPKEEAGDI